MRLVILDRDGVINADRDDYVKSPEEWHAIPGSLQAIVRLNKAGYKVAVVTNQSGISRGLLSVCTLDAIHDKMHLLLSELGGQIDKVVYCPHLPSAGCACRKPNAGLLQEIGNYFQCSLQGVPMVGDKYSDVQAAIKVGAQPFLIKSVYNRQGRYDTLTDSLSGGQQQGSKIPLATIIVDNLSQAVEIIIKNILMETEEDALKKI